ncbi:MAG: phospholipase [Chloroflexota bacterium]|nr:phospholipase [Chloroflexota bacterium]
MSDIGYLRARPGEMTVPAGPGLLPLGVDAERDSYLYVPQSYRVERPVPLVVMFHGAGGHAQHGISLLQHLADQTGLVILAPASRASTWDVIVDRYGPDVGLIDQALGRVFDRYAIDPARIAVGGFSDGASYALSLGITNGDLFTHILAFSPGFMAPAAQRGNPQIFISHGIHDTVLPIQRCSRRIVPQLERAGYNVLYREFDGGHAVPPEIAGEAVAWFADARR